MSIKFRNYNPNEDYIRVSNFLKEIFDDYFKVRNWTQPRWEYMHHHPYIKNFDRKKIGIWEDNGEIVAVVHPEHKMGTVYFQIAPGYENLSEKMIKYAIENLYRTGNNKKILYVYTNQHQKTLIKNVKKYGFQKKEKYSESMSIFEMPEKFNISIPEEFELISLADENKLKKIEKVLWRGFNHGKIPEYNIEDRKFMQSAPNFRKDLNIVIKNSKGDYVSYSGIFYDEKNQYSYVEPVATDPDYRRMGLGKTAVLECIRRTKKMGAKYAYVGTSMQFYLSFGFNPIYKIHAWKYNK
ncbi:MAG: GNAT family N-acetyltransferase [Candidatus Mcinerneyibacterium aminivorans]|uniref:GNAT family N-acetyltransferase n=1 Tax=Candidatus Mcinerneyibacterium aminivorans TaxID=2703815 RepID=A0A5D0MBN7_9BACT|nr:MAG: GNAT family N-acetyltransferase [Candidatus Mcinerneyibacterium aminivorans]